MAGRSWRVLAAILVVYAVIIGLDDAGGLGRLLVLGYLLDGALRLRGRSRHHWLAWGTAGLIVAAGVATTLLAPARVTSGLVGAGSLVLTSAVVVVIGSVVVRRHQLDTPSVVAVLAIYLLLALLFASLNQFLAAIDPAHYLAGVTGLPTAADQLYFSVITLATVGFGDIAPASELARAVTVVEALSGQLYLVSVVAVVVGGWRPAT